VVVEHQVEELYSLLVPLNQARLIVPRACVAEPDPGGRTRVAIFNGLAGLLENGVFGLLTEGFPQLVRVNRDVMEVHDQHAWPDDGPVICQIKMINEYPLIPDLEKIETILQDYLSTEA
jgi:chemosensory pili system protein ChpC